MIIWSNPYTDLFQELGPWSLAVKTIGSIPLGPEALFVSRVKRIILIRPMLNTISSILWDVGATEEGANWLVG